MRQLEGWVGSRHTGGYTIVGRNGHIQVCLSAGDRLEILVGETWQVVRVESGGYKGWYYVMADGTMARFALCMPVRGYQAAKSSIGAAPQLLLEPVVVLPRRYVQMCKRGRGLKRGMVVESVETLPSGVLVLHLAKRPPSSKGHST